MQTIKTNKQKWLFACLMTIGSTFLSVGATIIATPEAGVLGFTFAILLPVLIALPSSLWAGEMMRRLNALKREAEVASETQARFLANMSHEIRTPINGILGMAEVLNDSILTVDQKECTRTILNSSQSLLSIVNDILDFSKSEAGHIQLVEGRFSLRRLLDDVVSLLDSTVGEKDLQITVDYSPKSPEEFIGDEGRIRQIGRVAV